MVIQFYDPVKVKKLRKTSGLTQQSVADALKKHRVTIARFESGITGSLDLLIEYTKYFGKDYQDFLLPITPETTSKIFL